MLRIRSSTTHKSYELKEILSTGRFAAVYHAIDREKKTHHAIKTLLHERHDVTPYMNARIIHNETHNWPKVNGRKGILRLEEIIKDDVTNQTYIVSEMCFGGSLSRIVKEDMDLLLRCMKDTLEGIHSCHEAEIIHADIKPDNVLLRRFDGDACIGDFGSSIDATGHQGGKIARGMLMHCTPAYAAPEIMESYNSGDICFKMDMWSYGIMLRDVMLPAMDKNDNNHKNTILCRHLVNACLETNPTLRISSDDALKHELWSTIA